MKFKATRHLPPRAQPLFKHRYWPTQGLLYSLLFHEIVFFGLALVSMTGVEEWLQLPQTAATIDPRELTEVIYLPDLGSGNPGWSLAQAMLEARQGESAPMPATGLESLTHPGPQPIVSDPAEPTQTARTILQPELEDPPVLEAPLPLPNLVKIAAELTPREAPRLDLPPPPIDPVAGAARLSIQLGDLVDVLEPALELTPANVPEPALPLTPIAPVSTAKGLEAPVIELPDLAPRRLPQARAGLDERSLLAISPTPGRRSEVLRVPLGEARGRFAIFPQANPNLSETELGAGLEPSSVPFTPGAETNGSSGAGNGSGSATDGDPRGEEGEESFSGSGTGSGGGSGVGSGEDVFAAGITIIGDGTLTRTGRNPVTVVANPPPLRDSYGSRIISTEASGGGLPYFGVFESEQVHTVYLDMRTSVDDAAPRWTLEFGIHKEAVPAAVSKASADTSRLVLPLPVVKERPQFSRRLVSNYLGQMVVVYAVINVEGRLEQTSVKQSPDPMLAAPLLSALGEWVFQPAELGGEPIAVKVLMGVPVWSAE